MPPEGIVARSHDEILSFEEIVRVVQILKQRFVLSKVHITGGEPLARKGVCDLVDMLAKQGIPDLALTTNGQSLAAMAAPLKRAGLVRVNVSLDSMNPATYAELTRGGDVRRTLQGIEAARRAGLGPVKINTVVLRNWNSHEVTDLAGFALAHGCWIRFLELMPIGSARNMWTDSFVPSAEVRAMLEERFALFPDARPAGGGSRNFLADDHRGLRGVIGFISSESEPFCSDCTRLRLTSVGDVISCLACGTGPNVKSLLRSPGTDSEIRIAELVAGELARKRPRERFSTKRQMAAVGG
jgi:cyclic pyranopterin phosphate synthase